MKTLQNNFTTPEQSKRLLELGIPADSADCYINWYVKSAHQLPSNYTYTEFYEFHKKAGRIIQPCWSVGRLIEIYCIAKDVDFIEFDIFADGTNILSQIIKRIEDKIKELDFSKLN